MRRRARHVVNAIAITPGDDSAFRALRRDGAEPGRDWAVVEDTAGDERNAPVTRVLLAGLDELRAVGVAIVLSGQADEPEADEMPLDVAAGLARLTAWMEGHDVGASLAKFLVAGAVTYVADPNEWGIFKVWLAERCRDLGGSDELLAAIGRLDRDAARELADVLARAEP
jgi:hypothetical protein